MKFYIPDLTEKNNNVVYVFINLIIALKMYRDTKTIVLNGLNMFLDILV